MQSCGRRLIQIHIDSPAMLDDQRAQIIDAMGMVRMGVGEEYPIEPIHTGIEKLLTQIGRGIDQNARDSGTSAALNQKRGPAAAVLGVSGIAIAPTERRTR